MSSRKILVIDDEIEFLEKVKMRLEMNNYNVLTASDGHDGVKQAIEGQPDLILMDIMMPNLNGGDAVKLLKANQATNQIPVVFLTAVLSKSEENIQQGINIGEVNYPAISKPYDPDQLLEVIESNISS